MEQRPTKLTPEAALRVATELAEQLAKAGHFTTDEVAGAALDIAKCARRRMDGYELAKELDSLYGWDCNLHMAEELDGFSSLADDEIKQAEKEWVERNNIQPPLPIGARVVNKSGETGTIDEVYEYGVARYCVKMDGKSDPDTWRIEKFESLTAIDTQPQS